MSAYLKFFELERAPFDGESQSPVVLGTQALRDAVAMIESGLAEGASRICLSGGPGLGKTSLARALPKLLRDGAKVAVILDPDVAWESLRGRIAKQWGIPKGGLARKRLLEAARDRRLILVIDQAERASEEFLDHLDVVLSYRSETGEPVIQSVLLAQLGANTASAPPPLVWWLDRIQTLQLEFAPLPRTGVEPYIHKHLKRAGWRGGRLFTNEATLAIHGYTAGVPGEVSMLCERLLAEAAARDLRQIDDVLVHALCDDHEELSLEDALDDVEEEEWTFANEFEELVLEHEFGGPGDFESAAPRDAESSMERAAEDLDRTDSHHLDAAGDATEAIDPGLGSDPADPAEVARPPSLVTTLEHFERSEREARSPDASPAGMGESQPQEAWAGEGRGSSWGDATDPDARDESAFTPGEAEPEAELWDLERSLSAPPSEAELREIRGSFIARNARPVVIAALAATIGGVAFALLTGPSEPSRVTPAEDPTELIPVAASKANLTGPSQSDRSGTPPVLGRIRGRDSDTDSHAATPATASDNTNNGNSHSETTRSAPQGSSPAAPKGNAIARRAGNAPGVAPNRGDPLAGIGDRLQRLGDIPKDERPTRNVGEARALEEAAELEGEGEGEGEEVDLRPAALAPPPTLTPDTSERFW